MQLGLVGKTALVTGSARGIGRAIALRLASEGAALAVNDREDGPGLQSLVEEIRAGGGEAMSAVADVADAEAVRRIVAAVDGWRGGLDILVNNAGIVSRKSVVDVSDGEWDRVLEVNLHGCFHGCQAAARAMRARGSGGRIVNISSIHAKLAKAGMGSYCTSKAAIEALSKQLAVELAPDRIAVNVVACGTIRTDINLPLYQSTAPEDRALQQALIRRVPAGEIGEPDDIAHAVTFLCSNLAARYVTGAVLYVDGGYTADGTARI